MTRSDPIQKTSREEQNGQQIILSGQNNRTRKANAMYISQNDKHEYMYLYILRARETFFGFHQLQICMKCAFMSEP